MEIKKLQQALEEQDVIGQSLVSILSIFQKEGIESFEELLFCEKEIEGWEIKPFAKRKIKNIVQNFRDGKYNTKSQKSDQNQSQMFQKYQVLQDFLTNAGINQNKFTLFNKCFEDMKIQTTKQFWGAISFLDDIQNLNEDDKIKIVEKLQEIFEITQKDKQIDSDLIKQQEFDQKILKNAQIEEEKVTSKLLGNNRMNERQQEQNLRNISKQRQIQGQEPLEQQHNQISQNIMNSGIKLNEYEQEDQQEELKDSNQIQEKIEFEKLITQLSEKTALEAQEFVKILATQERSLNDFHTIENFLLKMQNEMKQENILTRQAYQNFFQIQEIIQKQKSNLGISEEEYPQKQQDFKKIIQKISALVNQIQILDLNLMKNYYLEGINQALKVKGLDIVLLIGATGSGKSTSIHFLAGSKFKQEIVNGINHLNPINITNNNDLNYIKCSSEMKSETKFISPVQVSLHEWDQNIQQNIFLCDTPGFEDTQGTEIDVPNCSCIYKAISYSKSVRLVLVLSFLGIGNRLEGIRKLVQQLIFLVKDIVGKSESIAYIFTKFEKSNQEKLLFRVEELRDSLTDQEGSNEKAFCFILDDIICKLKAGNLAFFIDPINDDENQPSLILNKIRELMPVEEPQNHFRITLSKSSQDKLLNFARVMQDCINQQLGQPKVDFEYINNKLVQIKQLNEISQKTFIDTIYQDTIKIIIKQFKGQFKEQKENFTKRVLNYQSRLQQKDIFKFDSAIQNLEQVQQILSKHINVEVKNIASFLNKIYQDFEKIKENFNKLDFQSKELSQGISKILLIKNNTNLLDKNNLQNYLDQAFQISYQKMSDIINAFCDKIKKFEFNQALEQMIQIEEGKNNFIEQGIIKEFILIVTQKYQNPQILEKDYLFNQIQRFVYILIEKYKQTTEKSVINTRDIQTLNQYGNNLFIIYQNKKMSNFIKQEDIEKWIQSLQDLIQTKFHIIKKEIYDLNEKNQNYYEIEKKFDEMKLLTSLSLTNKQISQQYQEQIQIFCNAYDKKIQEGDEMLKKIDLFKEGVNYQLLKKSIDCYQGTKGIFKAFGSIGARYNIAQHQRILQDYIDWVDEKLQQVQGIIEEPQLIKELSQIYQNICDINQQLSLKESDQINQVIQNYERAKKNKIEQIIKEIQEMDPQMQLNIKLITKVLNFMKIISDQDFTQKQNLILLKEKIEKHIQFVTYDLDEQLQIVKNFVANNMNKTIIDNKLLSKIQENIKELERMNKNQEQLQIEIIDNEFIQKIQYISKTLYYNKDIEIEDQNHRDILYKNFASLCIFDPYLQIDESFYELLKLFRENLLKSSEKSVQEAIYLIKQGKYEDALNIQSQFNTLHQKREFNYNIIQFIDEQLIVKNISKLDFFEILEKQEESIVKIQNIQHTFNQEEILQKGNKNIEQILQNTQKSFKELVNYQMQTYWEQGNLQQIVKINQNLKKYKHFLLFEMQNFQKNDYFSLYYNQAENNFKNFILSLIESFTQPDTFKDKIKIKLLKDIFDINIYPEYYEKISGQIKETCKTQINYIRNISTQSQIDQQISRIQDLKDIFQKFPDNIKIIIDMHGKEVNQILIDKSQKIKQFQNAMKSSQIENIIQIYEQSDDLQKQELKIKLQSIFQKHLGEIQQWLETQDYTSIIQAILNNQKLYENDIVLQICSEEHKECDQLFQDIINLKTMEYRETLSQIQNNEILNDDIKLNLILAINQQISRKEEFYQSNNVKILELFRNDFFQEIQVAIFNSVNEINQEIQTCFYSVFDINNLNYRIRNFQNIFEKTSQFLSQRQISTLQEQFQLQKEDILLKLHDELNLLFKNSQLDQDTEKKLQVISKECQLSQLDQNLNEFLKQNLLKKQKLQLQKQQDIKSLIEKLTISFDSSNFKELMQYINKSQSDASFAKDINNIVKTQLDKIKACLIIDFNLATLIIELFQIKSIYKHIDILQELNKIIKGYNENEVQLLQKELALEKQYGQSLINSIERFQIQNQYKKEEIIFDFYYQPEEKDVGDFKKRILNNLNQKKVTILENIQSQQNEIDFQQIQKYEKKSKLLDILGQLIAVLLLHNNEEYLNEIKSRIIQSKRFFNNILQRIIDFFYKNTTQKNLCLNFEQVAGKKIIIFIISAFLALQGQQVQVAYKTAEVAKISQDQFQSMFNPSCLTQNVKFKQLGHIVKEQIENFKTITSNFQQHLKNKNYKVDNKNQNIKNVLIFVNMENIFLYLTLCKNLQIDLSEFEIQKETKVQKLIQKMQYFKERIDQSMLESGSITIKDVLSQYDLICGFTDNQLSQQQIDILKEFQIEILEEQQYSNSTPIQKTIQYQECFQYSQNVSLIDQFEKYYLDKNAFFIFRNKESEISFFLNLQQYDLTKFDKGTINYIKDKEIDINNNKHQHIILTFIPESAFDEQSLIKRFSFNDTPNFYILLNQQQYLHDREIYQEKFNLSNEFIQQEREKLFQFNLENSFSIFKKIDKHNISYIQTYLKQRNGKDLIERLLEINNFSSIQCSICILFDASSIMSQFLKNLDRAILEAIEDVNISLQQKDEYIKYTFQLIAYNTQNKEQQVEISPVITQPGLIHSFFANIKVGKDDKQDNLHEGLNEMMNIVQENQKIQPLIFAFRGTQRNKTFKESISFGLLKSNPYKTLGQLSGYYYCQDQQAEKIFKEMNKYVKCEILGMKGDLLEYSFNNQLKQTIINKIQKAIELI